MHSLRSQTRRLTLLLDCSNTNTLIKAKKKSLDNKHILSSEFTNCFQVPSKDLHIHLGKCEKRCKKQSVKTKYCGKNNTKMHFFLNNDGAEKSFHAPV